MFWKLNAIWKQNFFTICFLNINPPLLPLPWGNGCCWILIFDIGYILQRKNNFIEPIKYFLKKCSEEFHLLQVSFNISHWKWNDPVITITETTSFKSTYFMHCGSNIWIVAVHRVYAVFAFKLLFQKHCCQDKREMVPFNFGWICLTVF